MSRLIEILNYVKEVCTRLESRPARQQMLYDEFVRHVKFDLEQCTIDISGLVETYPYRFAASSVLSGIYCTLTIGNYDQRRNMFSVDEKQLVLELPFDRDNYDHMELTDRYKQQLLSSSQQAEVATGQLTKITPPQSYYSSNYTVVVTDAYHNYDCLKLESDLSEDKLRQRLYEVKRFQPLDSPTVEMVLELAISRGCSHIQKLDDIVIDQDFNGSNIYQLSDSTTTTFSSDATITAVGDDLSKQSVVLKTLLRNLSLCIRADGEASITKQETVDKIRSVAHQTLTVNICDQSVKDRLVADLLNQTTHSNGDTIIEIGKLMDSYNIDSDYLLYTMYAVATVTPSEVCLINAELNRQQAQKFNPAVAKHELEKYGYYIDYLFGSTRIKTAFRQAVGEQQSIIINKYDYDNRGWLYSALLLLMASQLQQTSLN